MTVSEFSWSRRRRRSCPTTPRNPISLSMVAVEPDEGYRSRKRVFVDHNKAKSSAMERAEEVKAHLDPRFPSFVKFMIRSHVSSCFVLHPPIHFCRSYLPKENVMMNLIDENQEKYPVKYLMGGWFSAGWKDFSVEHKLVEGDALVFQLVKPTQFQVHIIRAFSIAEVDGVFGLLKLCSQQKQIESYKRSKRMREKTATRLLDALLLAVLLQPKEDTTSNNDEAGLEVSQGTNFQPRSDFTKIKDLEKFPPRSDFPEIKDLESFVVVVNGSVIDSLLSKEEHSKYFELCCSQKHCLHNDMPDRIDSKLAAGIISQIIEVADSIRAAKPSISEEEFTAWDKKLDVLELLGMDVGFLRARVEKLSSLLPKSKEVMYSKRTMKMIAQRDETKQKIIVLKDELTELERTFKQYEKEMETMKVKVGDREVKFRAVVDAPW